MIIRLQLPYFLMFTGRCSVAEQQQGTTWAGVRYVSISRRQQLAADLAGIVDTSVIWRFCDVSVMNKELDWTPSGRVYAEKVYQQSVWQQKTKWNIF